MSFYGVSARVGGMELALEVLLDRSNSVFGAGKEVGPTPLV